MKLASFLVFILFLGKSYFFLDADFGWHLKMGEIIVSAGIPASDPFSYTMPSYLFIDHEWLSNLIVYIGYQSVGWIGLIILFSFFATLALILPFLTRPRKYNFLPILLGAGFLASFVGVRMQIVTLLFFSILVTIFFNKRFYKKFKYFLPILFLFWVNLHGGFAVGIFIYSIYLIVNLFKSKKLIYSDWLIFSLSFLATFINPYGWRIWHEVYMQMTDSTLRWAVSEWAPAFTTYHPILWIIIVFSIYLIIKYRNSYNLFEKILYFGLLAAGFLSIRHMTLWVIVALPLMHEGILILEKQVDNIKHGKERLKKAYLVFSGIAIVVIFVTYFLGIRQWNMFGRDNLSPVGAVNYLEKNTLEGQIFSIYNWGGYLIWNLPNKKVFIDGRMPSWRRETAPFGESKNAHEDYRNLIDGNVNFSNAAEKYNIDTVLLPQKSKQSGILIKKNINSEFGSIYSQLEKNGWRVIYQDDVSIIYKKIN